MEPKKLYRLDAVTVLDVVGADAEKIVHNLVTNEIKSLAIGQGCESFVTDVKGKTLGHVVIFRGDGFLRLIGAAGQSESIAAHIDRYTIVEDATPTIRDDEFVAVVMPPDLADDFLFEPNVDGVFQSLELHQFGAFGYGVDWLGSGSGVSLIPTDQWELATRYTAEQGYELQDVSAFHHRRTMAGFPWYGIDFSDKNLPQEVNRDAQTLSFTKGCYLGQETIARLDALGQVQKKLVRWAIGGSLPEPPVEVKSGDKTVGRLTSVAVTGDNEAVAIGIARRSHFDPGSQAAGTIATGSQQFTAEVL